MFSKNVWGPTKPPDELAQNVSKKNSFRTNYSSFSSKVQNLTVFSIIYMIRIRFFGPRELIQNGFRVAQYAWKHRMSSTKRFAEHQDYHGLFSDRTHNVVNKISTAKMLEQHCGLPNPWHTNHFQQWNSRMQHLRTRSRSWSRSSRSTSTKNTSFRTQAKRRRSTSSAMNRRNWLPTWTTTPRSLNLAKILPNTNVLNAIRSGDRESSIAVLDEIWNLCRVLSIFQQNKYDVTSIPGYVIKKNSSRGVNHGPSERQRMYHHAKQKPKKARQRNHGRHQTITARWYADKDYRDSLSAIGWKEKEHKAYDRIAFDKHHHTATQDEIIQNSKHWILTLNTEGPQQPLFSTTWLCSSVKGMQTIAWRASGKDPAKL